MSKPVSLVPVEFAIEEKKWARFLREIAQDYEAETPGAYVEALIDEYLMFKK